MFISSATKRKYVLDQQQPVRVRGTPEYNPLYDTFQATINPAAEPPRNEFRPITPSVTTKRSTDTENAYDRPRSYRVDDERESVTYGRRPQKQARAEKNAGEIFA